MTKSVTTSAERDDDPYSPAPPPLSLALPVPSQIQPLRLKLPMIDVQWRISHRTPTLRGARIDEGDE